ncbi:MAG: hypothetical protein OCC49_18405 [Fibrobacterales bacterium]
MKFLLPFLILFAGCLFDSNDDSSADEKYATVENEYGMSSFMTYDGQIKHLKSIIVANSFPDTTLTGVDSSIYAITIRDSVGRKIVELTPQGMYCNVQMYSDSLNYRVNKTIRYYPSGAEALAEYKVSDEMGNILRDDEYSEGFLYSSKGMQYDRFGRKIEESRRTNNASHSSATQALYVYSDTLLSSSYVKSSYINDVLTLITYHESNENSTFYRRDEYSGGSLASIDHYSRDQYSGKLLRAYTYAGDLTLRDSTEYVYEGEKLVERYDFGAGSLLQEYTLYKYRNTLEGDSLACYVYTADSILTIERQFDINGSLSKLIAYYPNGVMQSVTKYLPTSTLYSSISYYPNGSKEIEYIYTGKSSYLASNYVKSIHYHDDETIDYTTFYDSEGAVDYIEPGNDIAPDSTGVVPGDSI